MENTCVQGFGFRDLFTAERESIRAGPVFIIAVYKFQIKYFQNISAINIS